MPSKNTVPVILNVALHYG